jgi:hypothetical protein
MAQSRLSRNEPIEFELICKGLRKEEIFELYEQLGKKLGGRQALRNPFSPVFDPRSVHEILVRVPWVIIGSVAGKRAVEKAIDIIAGVVERKLAERNDTHKKTVTIWGPDGKPAVEVIAKPERKRHDS